MATRAVRLVSLLLCVLFALAYDLALPAAAHAQSAVQASPDAPLFINVTSEDPWKVAMSAFFGTAFALKQGHQPVVMFVNVQAVPLFTKAKAGVRSEQFGKTVHEMVQEFQAAGGKVLVCPVCMKALDIPASDLIPGAEVATVASVNAILFRPDTKTLAW